MERGADVLHRPPMQKNPITPEGATKLREELNHLKSVERPAIIQAIAVAREHGDLSENAEYHAARERQSFIEGRVKELENKLALAEVIDPSKLAGDRVAFGANVKVSNTVIAPGPAIVVQRRSRLGLRQPFLVAHGLVSTLPG